MPDDQNHRWIALDRHFEAQRCEAFEDGMHLSTLSQQLSATCFDQTAKIGVRQKRVVCLTQAKDRKHDGSTRTCVCNRPSDFSFSLCRKIGSSGLLADKFSDQLDSFAEMVNMLNIDTHHRNPERGFEHRNKPGEHPWCNDQVRA